jgi:hypothetical protein
MSVPKHRQSAIIGSVPGLGWLRLLFWRADEDAGGGEDPKAARLGRRSAELLKD